MTFPPVLWSQVLRERKKVHTKFNTNIIVSATIEKLLALPYYSCSTKSVHLHMIHTKIHTIYGCTREHIWAKIKNIMMTDDHISILDFYNQFLPFILFPPSFIPASRSSVKRNKNWLQQRAKVTIYFYAFPSSFLLFCHFPFCFNFFLLFDFPTNQYRSLLSESVPEKND